MRDIERLSTTGLHLWENYTEDFYLRYLSDNRPEREPQSPAMAVGSSFDAFVKCALFKHLNGHEGPIAIGRDGNPQTDEKGNPLRVYDLQRLFEEQVSNKEIRPWAWEAGKYAFDCYRTWGVYEELLRELEKSEKPPRFEFELRGEIGGVPVVGKPDLWYFRGVDVVYDWKVMGYCSKHSNSPKKLYKCCRDCWGSDRAKQTRGGGEPKPHKKYEEVDHFGHSIGSHWMEDVDKKWSDQLCTYAALLGVEIGNEDTIVGIDQLACKPNPEEGEKPLIRVAQHRARISKGYQEGVVARFQRCWDAIKSGHVFQDLSLEESRARCEVLDMQQPEATDNDDTVFWAEVGKTEYRG